MDTPADELVDRIYETTLHPERWQAVVESFSVIFGGSPVHLGILVSGVPDLEPRYVTGLPRGEGMVQFLEYLVELPAWSMRVFRRHADRFGVLSEDFGHVDLESTLLYAEWMKPRGLAPIWPAGHMLLGESTESLGGFFVFRRVGEGPFTEAELAHADRYVPHLRRAIRVLERLGRAQRNHLALAEVLDRLPTGVLLLDAQRRVVVLNQTAQGVVDQGDGLRVDRGGPSAVDARDNATLQKRIADALQARADSQSPSGGFVTVSRPSGKRGFALLVSPLRAPDTEGTASDVAVAIFIVDPEASATPGAEGLEHLYSLTHSEAEIVRLMASGLSLEDAARARRISMNTARSHLKRAFSKTGTSRQGELVRLIVSGVGAIRDR